MKRPSISAVPHDLSRCELYRLTAPGNSLHAGTTSTRFARSVRLARLRLLVAAALAAACAWVPAVARAENAGPPRAFIAGARFEADSTLVLTRDTLLRMPGTSKERADLPARTRLSRIKSTRVRGQGKAYDVELWRGNRPAGTGDGGFGEDVAVLAVFPQGEREPTDVAEVQTDRETYLHDQLVPLGSDDAFELVNAHLNAGEDYNDVSLFHLRDGRLRRIAQISIGAQRGGDCRESFQQRIHWLVEGARSGMPSIVADLETIRAPAQFVREDCPGRKVRQRSEHLRTAYRWDAAKDRYVAAARASRPGR